MTPLKVKLNFIIMLHYMHWISLFSTCLARAMCSSLSNSTKPTEERGLFLDDRNEIPCKWECHIYWKVESVQNNGRKRCGEKEPTFSARSLSRSSELHLRGRSRMHFWRGLATLSTFCTVSVVDSLREERPASARAIEEVGSHEPSGRRLSSHSAWAYLQFSPCLHIPAFLK